MAVAVRLTRRGCKKNPFYRIVAADSRRARDGKFLEVLGTYNPIKDASDVTINQERMTYWINNGARLSPTVKSILAKQAKQGV